MARKISKKERRLIIRILRGILFSFMGLLLFLLIVTGALYLNRDNISSRVLLNMNKHTQGELSFESISFTPFVQFPSISLLIKEVEFYEHHMHERNQNELPIAEIERIYAAMDVLDLIRGRVQVSEILLERGKLHMIRYPDSSWNFLNAVEILSPLPGVMVDDSLNVLQAGVSSGGRVDAEDSSAIEINLDHIYLEDIKLEFDNRIEENLASFDFVGFKAQLEYTPEAIRSHLETDIRIQYLKLAGKDRIENSNIQLETSVEFSRLDHILQLDPSLLVVNRAKLKLEGQVSFEDDGFIDLKFSGSDDDFGLSQLVLSETGIRNLEQGDLYFEGSLKDNNLKGMPVLDLSFGISNVKLLVPKTGKYISELNCSGRFNSGKKADFSAAWVEMDTIYAELPDGHLNGTFSAKNFLAPEFNLNWNSVVNLEGLDQVFTLKFLDSLSGTVSSKVFLDSARFDPDSRELQMKSFDVDLEFSNTSLVFPQIMSIDLLDGRIHHQNDTTRFYDLKAKVDDTDLFVNGNITNVFYIPFNIDTLITAELEIRSEMFDLPGFLDFVPVVRQAFPFRIKDLDLGVNVTTSTQRFLQMRPNPSMTFDIKHLDAEVENLLPPVSIHNGVFELDHRSDRVYLDFKDFEVDIMEASLAVDLELNSPAKRRNYLVMEIGIENLNPGKLIWNEETDTIPEFLNGDLNGSFLLDIHFPHDSLQTLKKVDLRQADLSFINARDTIVTSSMHILAEDIYIDPSKDPNPFASLTTDLILGSEKSSLNGFTWVGYDFTAEARDGKYTVHPGQSRIFGKEGKGIYTLDPFSENPRYEIVYQVDQYEVKDLMNSFLQDSIITGKMDFGINMVLDIPGDQKTMKGLNGTVVLKGEDLTLYGIDLDDFIKKFERSQNFNLVDLGAVMLLGPAGIALSKGGSYANILVSDRGTSSTVTKLKSEIQFEQGRAFFKDVAFATEENRVAAQGWIDLTADSLDIVFAIIDKRGCSTIEQQISGSTKEPEKSRVRFFETILAPVTNLLQAAAGGCEPFYTGTVTHPEKK